MVEEDLVRDLLVKLDSQIRGPSLDVSPSAERAGRSDCPIYHLRKVLENERDA